MIYLTFYHHRRWVYCVTAVVKGTDKTTRRMIFIDGKKGNIVLLRANKSPLLRRRDLLSSFLEFVHALSGSSFCRISLWLFLQPSLRPGCLFRTVPQRYFWKDLSLKILIFRFHAYVERAAGQRVQSRNIYTAQRSYNCYGSKFPEGHKNQNIFSPNPPNQPALLPSVHH